MVQKTLRGYLARKQHQPRFKGIGKINDIRQNMKKMEEITNQLKGERDTMLKQMKDIEAQVDFAIMKIKVMGKTRLICLNNFKNIFNLQTNPKIKPAEIDALYDSLIAKMNQHMNSMKVKIQEQRNAEEQERLRQIQLKMEAERKAKEAEEQRVREEEETRRKKVWKGLHCLFAC